jgi:hypothetical protein
MYDCIIFTDVSDTLYSSIAIGAYKVAHSLRQNGYSCVVINHFSEYTDAEFEKIVDFTVSQQTRLIGFSTTFLRTIDATSEYQTKFQDLSPESVFPQGKETENFFLSKCRSRNPNIKTMAGGAKVNRNFSNKNIDYVCIGYSEESIIQLMNHLVHDEPIKNSTRNLWGRIIIEEPKQKTYDFANGSFEWNPEDILNHKVLPIEIGRGCIFQCKFCSYPMNGKHNLDFVKAENLLYKEFLTNYERFGITHYRIVDDTFNDHVEKINMMSRVINKLPFQPILWAYTRLDLLTTRPGTLNQLYDMGVRAMFFGIESFNPKTAKIVGKGFDCNKQIETIQKIRSSYDISMHGSFIIGLPEESIDSSINSYRRIESGEIPLHSYGFVPLYINRINGLYPSEFDKNWHKYGYEEVQEDSSKKHIKSATIQGINNFSPALNWKNSLTTFSEVVAVANQIDKEIVVSDTMYLEGETAMQIHGMNFPQFTFDKLRYSTRKNANLHAIEKVACKVFSKQYKEQLFKVLEEKMHAEFV